MMTTTRWEHFEHQADIGVRGIAPTLAQAFEQAALALTAVIIEPDKVAPSRTLSVDCEAPDIELLLTEWLNQLIFLMATEHMLFSRFAVSIDNHHLHATIYGEPLERERHQPTVEIKGATFTALSVRQQDDGNWLAQTVVDV